jgi:hypothetical protein
MTMLIGIPVPFVKGKRGLKETHKKKAVKSRKPPISIPSPFSLSRGVIILNPFIIQADQTIF